MPSWRWPGRLTQTPGSSTSSPSSVCAGLSRTRLNSAGSPTRSHCRLNPRSGGRGNQILLEITLQRYSIMPVYQYINVLIEAYVTILCKYYIHYPWIWSNIISNLSLSPHFPHSVLELIPMDDCRTSHVLSCPMSNLQSSASTSRSKQDLPKPASGRLRGKAKKTKHKLCLISCQKTKQKLIWSEIK